ncbi:MAG: Ni/Fe hydrogenase subunit alpha [Proteobacteria bacterium]|nr:Ni/Fe hydrogenase subunit alpha [Pseudomonadota bacterium]MBU1715468.1 Ni/Fe hydrogenase subunit alpha [Pseudomonadota bacterium]
MKRITIDPITRLEGHGKIEIFLDDQGNVANAYFQVPELRGFEAFCVGRPAEDMPTITNRICGVCPEAHHLASVKALDELFGLEPPPAAKKLRELLYMAFYVTDHTTHFYALGGPDFIIGPDAPPAERNILGVIKKVGLDIGKQVISCRARNHEVIKKLGGRGIHPAAGLPGGWSKPLSEENRREIAEYARQNVEFAQFTLKIFADIVLANPVYKELVTSDLYYHQTYYMGTVTPENKVNFYDGMIRVVNPEGKEFARYAPRDYQEHIAERVEPWTYLKFPYLKKVGWQGLTDGIDSGLYVATPLSRLNVADGMATPLAQEHFEQMHETFAGGWTKEGRRKPIHHRMATHWARLIELLYASEHMLELATDPEITSPDVRQISTGVKNKEGIGSVEAPRGTLTHHYTADQNGILTKVNMIVGTTNNSGPIAMSVKRAAEQLIKAGTIIEEGLLNRVEMAFRLYDPCLSCATHALPGKAPLEVIIRDPEGQVVRTISRRPK